MAQTEIQKRNLISIVHECLKKKQITLIESGRVSQKYLVSVGISSPLFKDFIDTYQGYTDSFQIELAEKIMGLKPGNQEYGVIIDDDLNLEFAFNNYFMDYDAKQQSLFLLTIENVIKQQMIIDQKRSRSSSYYDDKGFHKGPTDFAYPRRYDRCLRPDYIINRKKNLYGKGLLNRIRIAYSNNTIELFKTPKRTAPFYLISVELYSSPLKDFMMTYKGELDEFRKDLARLILHKGEEPASYSLLVSPELNITFAFNNAFARYDCSTKSIMYKSPEQILIERA